MTPVQLRDVLDTVVTSSESVTVDIVRHLSNCTLDIIGLAGFGYDFNALSLTAEPNELSVAFNDMFHALQDSLGISMLEWIFPILCSLVLIIHPSLSPVLTYAYSPRPGTRRSTPHSSSCAASASSSCASARLRLSE